MTVTKYFSPRVTNIFRFQVSIIVFKSLCNLEKKLTCCLVLKMCLHRTIYFLPIQTGFSGSCAPESAANPIEHSHLYDPTVLLQTWLAPQASGNWHSSKSMAVTKQKLMGGWREANFYGSLCVSGKLPTYPSPKPTLTLTSHLKSKCWIRGGVGGQLPRKV